MAADQEPASAPPSTTELIVMARNGDDEARDRLVERYLPGLRRWAHGRLPTSAREITDTDDLVQITLIRTLDRLGQFEPRHDGAFLGYLRKTLLNEVRDQIRAAARRPGREGLDERMAHLGPSPVEQAVGRQALERYEQALSRLGEEEQEAIIMRLEMGFSYPEIAAALGKPTGNAARMFTSRAYLRLSDSLAMRVRS